MVEVMFMTDVSRIARQVRKVILDAFNSTGRAPSVGDIMAAVGVSRPAVLGAFGEIAQIDTFWVEKDTENIRISPFSNVSTPYKNSIDGVQNSYAVCGIQALAMWAFFPGKMVHVDAYCRDWWDPISLDLKDGQIVAQSPDNVVTHLGVPVGRWSENLPFA
jgi:hypothetical protein